MEPIAKSENYAEISKSNTSTTSSDSTQFSLLIIDDEYSSIVDTDKVTAI